MAKDKKCDGCFYYRSLNNTDWYCTYIFEEGRRRPCPPGAECTVKITKKEWRWKKVKANENR